MAEKERRRITLSVLCDRGPQGKRDTQRSPWLRRKTTSCRHELSANSQLKKSCCKETQSHLNRPLMPPATGSRWRFTAR